MFLGQQNLSIRVPLRLCQKCQSTHTAKGMICKPMIWIGLISWHKKVSRLCVMDIFLGQSVSPAQRLWFNYLPIILIRFIKYDEQSGKKKTLIATKILLYPNKGDGRTNGSICLWISLISECQCRWSMLCLESNNSWGKSCVYIDSSIKIYSFTSVFPSCCSATSPSFICH